MRVRIVAKMPYYLRHIRLSVCPSTRMYQRGSHWTDFRKILYWGLLRKSVEKLQIWLKSDKDIRHITWIPTYVLLLPEIQILYKNIFVQQTIFLYCWQLHAAQQYTRRIHCCVANATMITWTHHNVTWYLHSLSRYLQCHFSSAPCSSSSNVLLTVGQSN
jgi:hypothetical protein